MFIAAYGKIGIVEIDGRTLNLVKTIETQRVGDDLVAGIHTFGDYLLVGTSAYIQIFDVSDPVNPVSLDYVELPGLSDKESGKRYSHAMAVDGNYIYTTPETDQMNLVRVNDNHLSSLEVGALKVQELQVRGEAQINRADIDKTVTNDTVAL